ncbi:putative Transmembrane protein 256-like protein [Hypsibius exemplaris]|uniref:Transmembrane protein 256-like protein n=1 Tax=Hypsibius exemplaris TaxID=2072580 RepID=A0A1W0WX66_HYPEX|nr:putative Transmembrane protein 256-like protein [Hypsibius exemplaris]
MTSIPGTSELERAVHSLWETVSPWIFNPTSSDKVNSNIPKTSSWLPSKSPTTTMVLPAHMSMFVRLAGLSGATAVILGAYGAHAFRKAANPEAREVFETGNRYHLIHSVALALAPLTKYPRLTGGLFLAGMVVFSGGLYGYALWQNQLMRRATPAGGVLLILAWLSMVL